MKDTRSFFEKLTGAVRMDDVEEDISEETSPTTQKAGQPWFDDENDEEGQLSVDVFQTPTDIIIKSMVAGVRPEDLDISITRDMVTIKGKRETERTISTDDYIHQELYWGSFARTISLPAEVDVEESEALEKHGLLIIKMPKLDKNRQTRLKVRG